MFARCTDCARCREGWADYFEAHKIQYAFFSAANATAIQEERARLLAIPDEEEGGSSEEESTESESESEIEEEGSTMKIPKSGNKLAMAGPSQGPGKDEVEEDEYDDGDDTDEELANKMHRGAAISTPGSDEADRTRILSVLELEDLFLKQAPEGEPHYLSFPCYSR